MRHLGRFGAGVLALSSLVAFAEDLPWPDDSVWCTVVMQQARDLNGDGVRDIVGFGSCEMNTETGPGVIRVESGAMAHFSPSS